MFIDQLVSQPLVLGGKVQQLLPARLICFGGGVLTHLHGERAIVLRPREFVFHARPLRHDAPQLCPAGRLHPGCYAAKARAAHVPLRRREAPADRALARDQKMLVKR